MAWRSYYNAASSIHILLTAVDGLFATPDWFYIEVAGYVFPTQAEGTMPVFRYYSATNADRLYLMSTTGAPPAAPPGYTFEFLAAYAYPTQTCCSVPLYTTYSAALNDHFYTTSILVRDQVIKNNGYVSQGILGYVLPARNGEHTYWSVAVLQVFNADVVLSDRLHMQYLCIQLVW